MELTPYLSWTSRSFMCASATSLAETPPSIVWTSRYKGMLASFAVGLGKSTTWSCARPEGRRGGPPKSVRHMPHSARSSIPTPSQRLPPGPDRWAPTGTSPFPKTETTSSTTPPGPMTVTVRKFPRMFPDGVRFSEVIVKTPVTTLTVAVPASPEPIGLFTTAQCVAYAEPAPTRNSASAAPMAAAVFFICSPFPWPLRDKYSRRLPEVQARNGNCCAKLRRVPLETAAKVEALSIDFRSQAALAEILGVSRSRVTRWLKGAGIDPLNAEKVDLLELVWSNLLRIYEPEAARSWLWGVNPLLGDRRPIDLVRAGRAEELMRAIRAERADSFA